MKIRTNSVCGGGGLAAMIVASVVYWNFFARDLTSYEAEKGRWHFALNYADHHVYLRKIEEIKEKGIAYEFTNDAGIALIYRGLGALTPFDDPDLSITALCFNLATLVGSYFLYVAICRKLRLGPYAHLTFFFNVYLVYFAQLINKDLLTVLVILLVCWCGLKRSYWPLLILLPFLALIRQQLAIFCMAALILYISPFPLMTAVILYVVTSLAAALLWTLVPVIGEESIGTGLNAKLMEFNRTYYVGYLIFNPLRVLQYGWSLLDVFNLGTNGGVDMAKVLRIPQVTLLLVLARSWLSVSLHPTRWLKTRLRPLVLVMYAYLIVWLMNPTVNARYVIVIAPVLVLCALYRKQATRSARRSKAEAATGVLAATA